MKRLQRLKGESDQMRMNGTFIWQWKDVCSKEGRRTALTPQMPSTLTAFLEETLNCDHLTMPFLAGQQSKFAVLKIDDDSESSSEDEGKRLVANAAKGRAGGSKKGGKGNSAGLVVHVIPPKPKLKGKKAKKLQPQVMDSDGFIVQDADEDFIERKFREDLREALKNSRESASNATQSPPTAARSSQPPVEKTEEASEKNAMEVLVSDLDKQASAVMSRTDGPSKARETQLITLYRTRLLETLAQLTVQTEAAVKAEAEANKYRNRYKRICELLRDAEVNEKAHMTVELEKARNVEAEMGTQIGTLQGELMQARSKIRELENKLKELDKR
uniref:Uncharacterized protein n=1 Tax=Ascaris lumbricoides TaxID=6252 RepID=A0A9J2P422_ASCLU